jgi:phosphomannomutase
MTTTTTTTTATTAETTTATEEQEQEQEQAAHTKHRRTVVLFDVDGTLTRPRQPATDAMRVLLDELGRRVGAVAVVGGSDLAKIEEQLGARTVRHGLDFVFAENGLVARGRGGAELGTRSILDELGEANLQRLINFCLRYIADLDIPVKRGTFVEFRSGMLNVSPIGRNCSPAERAAFFEYDRLHGVRARFVAECARRFGAELRLAFSIGGQISFDVFPAGWDKTYCLRFLDPARFDVVHFFGDRTEPGGNDHEISVHPRITSHTVTGPEDTVSILKSLFW